MKKVLNIALLISFVVTIMVPLTGVHIHKMASVIFLLLNIYKPKKRCLHLHIPKRKNPQSFPPIRRGIL